MKIETKYNLGDVVWFIADNKVKSMKIFGAETYHYYSSMGYHGSKEVKCINYFDYEGHNKINEDDCYSSKEELIKTL